MKSLLTITVLVSSALSIFSSSMKLYEMPVFKEALSAINTGKEVWKNDGGKDTIRISLSHDVSNESKENHAPLFTAKKEVNNSELQENHLNVFGVQVPNENARSNI